MSYRPIRVLNKTKKRSFKTKYKKLQSQGDFSVFLKDPLLRESEVLHKTNVDFVDSEGRELRILKDKVYESIVESWNSVTPGIVCAMRIPRSKKGEEEEKEKIGFPEPCIGESVELIDQERKTKVVAVYQQASFPDRWLKKRNTGIVVIKLSSDV